MGRPSHSVGIGYRRGLSAALLAAPRRVDFLEVVAEACRGDHRREVLALAEVWPVVPHGVKLSLGSAEGIDEDRARALGALARELRAPFVSEHVAFVRAGGREIGHLTELPMTRESVRVVARNVARLRKSLPDVPFLLENVARGFVWDGTAHEMSEGDFHAEIAMATGCDLLLDIANLYANATNAGLSPRAVLAGFPLQRVAMVHVAGGSFDGGFYFDTHADPVPDAVFELLGDVLASRPDAAVMLERDAHLDEPAALLAEVDRLRATTASMTARSPAPPRPPTVACDESTQLREDQARLARELTQAIGDTMESASIARARSVLARKRAEDALSLLPLLARMLSAGEAACMAGLASRGRAAALPAASDAFAIVDAAAAVPELARAAALDRLALRARFARNGDQPSHRRMPWLGRAVAEDGAAVWALKSFGGGSAVRLYPRS